MKIRPCVRLEILRYESPYPVLGLSHFESKFNDLTAEPLVVLWFLLLIILEVGVSYFEFACAAAFLSLTVRGPKIDIK